MAMSRFVARRTRPKRIISDGGKNFLGGRNAINEMLSLIEEEEIQKRYPDIHWWTNCPANPHSGGMFERFIRSAKEALYAIIGDGELNDEELNTAFTITEGLLNTRPISYISEQGKDPEPLTPGHFLRGAGFVDLAPVPKTWSFHSRWHYIQTLMDHFWTRFQKECIPKLHSMLNGIRRGRSELGKWSLYLRRKIEVGGLLALLKRCTIRQMMTNRDL